MCTLNEDFFNKSFLYLFSLLWLILIHYYQPFPHGGSGGLLVPFNSTTWIGASLIIALGIFKIASARKFYWDMQDIILLGVGVSLVLPILWSNQIYVELTYDRYFAIAAFILIIALIKQFHFTRPQSETLYLIIIASGLIQSIYTVFTYLSPTSIDIYIFGADITRPNGIFNHPNLLGSFIATTVALSFFLQINLGTLNSKWKLFLRIAFVISISVIVLTNSRTGILGALISLMALSWVMKSKDTNREIIKIWGLFLAGVALSFIWVWLKYLMSGDPYSLGDPLNVSARWRIYGLTLSMILEHPIAGWGIGSYQPMFMERLVSDSSQSILDIGTTWSHPHNELLFQLFEGGIYPVIALLIGALLITNNSLKGGIKTRALWFVSFPILLHTMTEFPLYESAPHFILLAILLAKMNAYEQQVVKSKVFQAGHIVAWTTPFIVSLFMITNLHTTYLFNKYWKSNGDSKHLIMLINPWGQPELLNVFKVISLKKAKSQFAANLAVELARYEMTMRPSASNYLNLIMALDKIGRHDESEQLKNIWDKKRLP